MFEQLVRSHSPRLCNPASRPESNSSQAMRTTCRACGSSKLHRRPSSSTLRSRNDVPFEEMGVVRSRQVVDGKPPCAALSFADSNF